MNERNISVQYTYRMRDQGAASRWALATFGPRSLRWSNAFYTRALPLALLAFTALQLGTERSGLSTTMRIVVAPVSLVPIVCMLFSGSDLGYGWRVRRRARVEENPGVLIEVKEDAIRITSGAETVQEAKLLVAVAEDRGRVMISPERGAAIAIPASAFADRAELETFFHAAATLVRVPAEEWSLHVLDVETAPFAFSTPTTLALLTTATDLQQPKPSLVATSYRVGTAVLATLWCALLVFATHPIWEQSVFFWWFVPLNLVLLAWTYFPKALVRFWERKALGSLMNDCPGVMVIDASCIQVATPAASLQVPWRSVTRMSRGEGVVVIHTNDGTAVTIARAWFRDDRAYDDALTYIASKVGRGVARAA